MKFQLPFVSRERYDERVAELATLRSELAAERDRNQKLWNFLNWRTGGVAFDPMMLAEHYQPRNTAAPAKAANAEAPEGLRGVRAPGQARREIAQFEVKAQQDFEKATPRPARISKEQTEFLRELDDAANEGQKMAGD